MISIVRQVCESLAEAHAAGIVHRDLKPTNIHLEEIGGDTDFVKVLDFGIAKILHGSTLDNSDLTGSGQMVGTFDYMAPEQMVGGNVTAQSDIYTLGVLLYEMITGERPFGDVNSPAEMLTAMVSRTPVPLSAIVDVPVELDRVVARCLDRDPLKRYRSVDELSNDLLDALSYEATQTLITAAELDVGDDTFTTIDQAPEAPDDVDPRTTLPGVAPPTRGKPWPLRKR